ncbi:PREDICTED: uncharacterized protein LOC105457164 [Wasmannia auropunctata]|uniref:uncharacterized protein LOC105457164 n=1 Tax=Wasmannia auropunctata TaxID=64793 RepID=UPI0005F01579|nr:PREDICTED: uncharacterized protein LOC105457164 [Wasmannia auropunctata]
MTRIYFLIFCYILNAAVSEPAMWLMQGDVFTEDEVTSRLIQLDTHKSNFSVSTRAEVHYWARPGKLISCVIAASVYQQGHVSVVEGGYGAKKVRVRYVTKTGKPDVFFVLVQAARKELVSVEGNVVKSPRVDIVYGPMTNWTFAEIQDALRNYTDIFPS